MEFIQYFGNVFEPYNFAILVLGTIGGLLLGATPGLSPTMTVALLIPFTFHMSSVSGLILLGAAYTSTVAGGAVSAILLKIPGAPANIATALDGHEMAKQNKATKALHFCFISSGVGGILGVFVLIFFTPVLARIALDFGPSQLFWVAILGVTVIATLACAIMDPCTKLDSAIGPKTNPKTKGALRKPTCSSNHIPIPSPSITKTSE